MAIYRSDEARKMSDKERGEKLDELRSELFREQGVKAAGGASRNPGRIRALRKTIARILTIGAEARASAVPTPKPQRTPAPPETAPKARASRGPKRSAPKTVSSRRRKP